MELRPTNLRIRQFLLNSIVRYIDMCTEKPDYNEAMKLLRQAKRKKATVPAFDSI
jgi:hypothetical protein